MSDWRDVMDARTEADIHTDKAHHHLESRPDRATLEALLAIRAELRALAVLIDFARGDAR